MTIDTNCPPNEAAARALEWAIGDGRTHPMLFTVRDKIAELRAQPQGEPSRKESLLRDLANAPKPQGEPVVYEVLPSCDGECYRRVKVNGEWFTVPVALLRPDPRVPVLGGLLREALPGVDSIDDETLRDRIRTALGEGS